MNVIAKKGTRCPKERKPRDYITDWEAVNVPETSYYLRLVADGSLRVVQEKAGKKKKPKTKKAKGGKR